MNLEELEAVIDLELSKRRNKVLNRNAYKAFFGMFSDPVGALGQIFIGRKDAIDAERARIAQEKMLEMLVTLDDAFSKSAVIAKDVGIEVQGLIRAKGVNVDHVVGLDIGATSSAVKIKPGTTISATLENGKSLTGLKIGG